MEIIIARTDAKASLFTTVAKGLPSNTTYYICSTRFRDRFDKDTREREEQLLEHETDPHFPDMYNYLLIITMPALSEHATFCSHFLTKIVRL